MSNQPALCLPLAQNAFNVFVLCRGHDIGYCSREKLWCWSNFNFILQKKSVISLPLNGCFFNHSLWLLWQYPLTFLGTCGYGFTLLVHIHTYMELSSWLSYMVNTPYLEYVTLSFDPSYLLYITLVNTIGNPTPCVTLLTPCYPAISPCSYSQF